jgi:glucose-1-phosphate cytidylyltransferase
MKYYAHYGHKDFILCLGYGGHAIKEYFLNYNECLSNDFVLSNGGSSVTLINKDIEDWRITFADTGLKSNLGQRLCRVKTYLEGEDYFLANYADGLSDLDLAAHVQHFVDSGKTACFVSVKLPQAFHIVQAGADGYVERLEQVDRSSLRVNGGFFVFRKEIFDHIEPGEELVSEPFQRLAAKRELLAATHDGFWHCMDTFKDKMALDELANADPAPWEVWAH